MSTAKRVIKNTGYLYAKMGITMFISLYTTRLVLNALGASDFGIFNIVGGAIAMLGFLNAAMAGATQRFMSYAEGEGDKEKQKKIFNISFILHLAVGLLLGIILLLAGWFFFNGILNIPADRIFAAKAIYGSLIISTVFTVITVPYDAVLNAHENMLYYAIVGIIESFLKLGAAWAVVLYAGDKLILYGILMACVPIITLTIMRIYCHRKYEECTIAPKKYWDKKLSKEMRNFAGWNFLGATSSLLSSNGINLLINVFHGTVANASQGIANQVSGQLGALGSAIKKAITPIIAKSAGAEDYDLMIKSTILGTKIILFIVTLMFASFMIEMPLILKIWLKNPPQDAHIFCFLLLITNFVNDLVLFLPQTISAIGKIKHFQIVNSIILFMPLIIAYIAYYYGAPAYAIYIISAGVGMIQNIIIMKYADKLCNISFKNYFTNVIVRCSLAFCITFFSGYTLTRYIDEGYMRLLFTVVFSTSTYLITFYFIGLNKEEQKYITMFANQYLEKVKLKRNEF